MRTAGEERAARLRQEQNEDGGGTRGRGQERRSMFRAQEGRGGVEEGRMKGGGGMQKDGELDGGGGRRIKCMWFDAICWHSMRNCA
jgi:hypothetical protein